MSVIAFIPVRGGSKSIPLKNIKSFCGMPLLYWTAKAANDSECVDEIIIASDNQKILDTAKNFGLQKIRLYEREKENAQDNSSTESVMLEYINKSGLENDDVFILVQATSPLTEAKYIDEAFKIFREGNYDSLLTCSRTKRFFWDKNGTAINYDYRSRPRRQDFDGTLMENGAFYISTVKAIKDSQCRLSGNITVYEMPEFCGIEIDEPSDWITAESLMRKYVLAKSKHEIKLFAMDIDGVLTDGGMYYSENGDEAKKFNATDGKGIELLRNSGIKTAVITSENMKLNQRRAEKLKIDFVFQGIHDKLKVAENLCRELNINMNNIAYIGDDINDIELLSSAGLSACPANATERVKSIPNILQLEHYGGNGAVREFCDYILFGTK